VIIIILALAASLVEEKLRVRGLTARINEQSLDAIVRYVGEAIITIDHAGTIHNFNPGAERMFGFDRDEIIGKDVSILLPEDQRAEHGGYLEQSSIHAPRIIGRTRPIRGRRKNGEDFALELSVSAMEIGGRTMFVGVARDVTAQRAAEDALRRTTEQAVAASEAKSQFLANMSHEIRTPMNGVIGMTEILLLSDLTPKQREQCIIIKESEDALLSILNDILDLSKIEADKLDIEVLDFPLQTVLDGVETIWGSRLRQKDLSLSIEVAPDVEPVLKTDPGRIRQVLFNLLGNAAKFTETGGVTLGVSQRRLGDDDIEIRFEIADTGIGITPEAQSGLFEKFNQADSSTTRKYGGTGLGLAICKQLAGLMGGDIGVESRPGEGSTFWFTIRCRPGDAALVVSDPWSRETGLKPMPAAGRGLHILVAEDNQVNQTVILAMLGSAGHEVDVVENGAEAVAAVMRTSYDVVLMDIQMPVMDGLAATREIRALEGDESRIPIIGVTANAMKGDRENYLGSGMNAYVTKPIDSYKLARAIASQCGGAIEALKPVVAPAAATEESQNELTDLVESLDRMTGTDG
jgi:PAS domain S-box-containing protein